MANSSYLSKVVEPFVRSWVSCRIGTPLAKKRVPVGQRTDGTPVHFEFDGVSADNQTSLLISTSGSLKTGSVHKLHADAATLLNAPFRRRLMAFVSEDVRRNFVNKCDGLLPLGQIEMLVCDELPAEMELEIARFQAVAKLEVGDRGRNSQLAKGRR